MVQKLAKSTMVVVMSILIVHTIVTNKKYNALASPDSQMLVQVLPSFVKV